MFVITANFFAPAHGLVTIPYLGSFEIVQAERNERNERDKGDAGLSIKLRLDVDLPPIMRYDEKIRIHKAVDEQLRYNTLPNLMKSGKLILSYQNSSPVGDQHSSLIIVFDFVSLDMSLGVNNTHYVQEGIFNIPLLHKGDVYRIFPGGNREAEELIIPTKDFDTVLW